MKDCKDMHESLWEVIRVECLFKRHCMQKLSCKKEKSLDSTEAHVVESMEENIQVDIKMQVPENKGTNSIDQQVQAVQEETYVIQEVAKEDPIIEVLHIDFIFVNRPLLLEDCVQYNFKK